MKNSMQKTLRGVLAAAAATLLITRAEAATLVIENSTAISSETGGYADNNTYRCCILRSTFSEAFNTELHDLIATRKAGIIINEKTCTGQQECCGDEVETKTYTVACSSTVWGKAKIAETDITALQVKDGSVWFDKDSVTKSVAPSDSVTATVPDTIDLGEGHVGQTTEQTFAVTLSGGNLDLGMGLGGSDGVLHIPTLRDDGSDFGGTLTAAPDLHGVVTAGYGMDFKQNGNVTLRWTPTGTGAMHATLQVVLSVH
ncbi:hypothetical protein F3I20_22515 [Candidatus Pantoea gossypiicola]|uniref:Uncharacterized protein n=1 Tax=Candidatus Pantoea gossypiicola TaxID=2608008 RepID=A0AB34CDN6_9GAMM|nr:hypothetical protein [Pantoea gossypiicola]KAA6118481.1 hypothetical protein F3I20_22515 [Pantoea gossypiicola]